MRARALTAQPLASSIGPRLRLCNLNQAMMTDGVEINSIRPPTAKGICHHLRPSKPDITPAATVPSAPTAKPIAAKIPANLPTSKALGGPAGAAIGGSIFFAAPVVKPVAEAPICASTPAALAAAILCMAAEIIRAKRL